MKLAIVADWLTVFGGAEHAIAEFHELWPKAPLFTTVARPEKLGPLAHADIRTTTLQRFYNIVKKHQALLLLMPRAVESMDLRGFDTILSSSHAVAKGIIPPHGSVHICYCHTPMRYAWEMEDEYLDDFRVPKLLRKAIKTRLKKLRRWDMTTAKRVDMFIANSSETQKRIQNVYARDSIIIPPPAADRLFQTPLIPAGERSYFLAIGRLVPYKRFDLLIEAANALRFPLRIAGTGQEEARLKHMAGPTVEFLGFVPDAELPQLYGGAKALLFPQYEDAGIVPLEAQACGTPVIAYARGGALDSVKNGVTGVFFTEQTPASISSAIQEFNTIRTDPQTIRAHAEQFSATRFRERMQAAVEDARKTYL
ncbi:MAG: group 1 glycosyl transferase [Candidatus Peribacteria bacterium]|nr:group 1 glycosyl transferase [Candidatus Peribacteria bacterium]